MSSVSTVKTVALASLLLAAALPSWAANKTWVGPSSGSAAFSTASYWDPEGMPDKDDSVIFDLGAENDLTITGNTNFRRITLKSGQLSFAGGSGDYHYHRNDTEFIVSNAAVIVYGGMTHYNALKTGYKMGEGELCVTNMPQTSSKDPFISFVVKAGTMKVYGNNVSVPSWTVEDGATLVASCNFNSPTSTVIKLAGPTARVCQDGTAQYCTMSGISGSGVIEGASGSVFICSLKEGPLSFSGRTEGTVNLYFTNSAQVAASDFAYTIQSATAFDHAVVADSGALRFADGIDMFTIGGLKGDTYYSEWPTRMAAKNVSGEPITIKTKANIRGKGIVFTGGTWQGVITNSTDSGNFAVEGTNTFADVALASDVMIALKEKALLVQTGGTLAAPTELDKRDTTTSGRLPTGIQFDDPTWSGTFRVASGKAYVNGGSSGLLPKRIEVTGGALTMVKSAWYGKYATAESPSELLVDGARVDVSCRYGGSTGKAEPYNFFRNDYAARVFVGSGGATFAAVDTTYNGFGCDNVGYTEQFLNVNKPIEPAAGVTAGPLTFRGWVKWRYNQAIASGLNVRFLDGGHYLNDAAVLEAANGLYFGDGDIYLRGALLGFGAGISTKSPLKLATAAGKTLTYAASAGLATRHLSTDGANAIEIGALARAGKGSALFLDDYLFNLGTDDASSVKVVGGMETNAYGFVKQPVFSDRYENFSPTPFKYDDAKGFVATTTADFETYSRTKKSYGYAQTTTSAVSADGDTTYEFAGLYIGNKIACYSGTVLKIGDGVNPACFMPGTQTQPITGGTVDFGTSEGVIVTKWGTSSNPRDLDTTLTGQNGISFVAGPQEIVSAAIRLKRANTHVGGTYVSGVRLLAAAEGCLSSGEVVVNGGEMAGGSIFFEAAGTYPNRFTVGGFGRRTEKYSNHSHGALVFQNAVTLTGDVVLTEPTRMSVDSELDAKIAGTVSGDRLSVYCTKASLNKGGVLELAGHNTYTGGTEILRQSVAIDEADGFGTGDVCAEQAELVFRNAADMTVANRIYGTGKLRVEGAGAVAFADIAGYNVTAFEVGPGAHAFNVDFPCRPLVGTGTTRSQRSVLVLKAGATYTLAQADLDGIFEIVLEDGATLDLAGGTLTVYRFTGDRADVNGTIVETNPKAGLMMIVR